ncbi:ATP-binding protein [Streptomyces sp. NBC_01298]|uniref:ATP-binding protein n=1 Tax=Streptomyces sp. NBC_01298 TaxID=2903817 RepID=UPI002E15E05C
MPAHRVPGLFEPFRRLDADRTTTPGNGLGLSIAASVTQAHHAALAARARQDPKETAWPGRRARPHPALPAGAAVGRGRERRRDSAQPSVGATGCAARRARRPRFTSGHSGRVML